MKRKIFSIAPSFNCSLSCKGCYLTTGVTKEMRDLTKDDYYWGRAMEEAVKAGYREFAITLNPFPGAIEHTTKLAKMAKKKGFEVVNVTTVYKGVFEDEAINPLLPHIDIVSMSVDDMRCKDPDDMWSQVDVAWDLFAKNTHIFILISIYFGHLRCSNGPKKANSTMLLSHLIMAIERTGRFNT